MNQLSQLKVAVDEAPPISREPDAKAPLTFLIAKDGISDFTVLESSLPSKTGSVKEALSSAYITNKNLRKEFSEYHFFVCGKWKDGKWEYVKQTEKVDHEAQYVVIMTVTQQTIRRVNGATYASNDCSQVDWHLSVLATSVFAAKPIFDNNWKRIPSKKEHNYTSIHQSKDTVSSMTGKDCTTYLEMFSECMPLKCTDMVTVLIKGREFISLNDLCTECTVGTELFYDTESTDPSEKGCVRIELCKSNSVSPDLFIPLHEYFNTPRGLLTIADEANCEFCGVVYPTGGFVVPSRAKKVEGKILCHFVCQDGCEFTVESLFVETGSDLLTVLPEMSVKFEIPLDVLRERTVHFFDDDMVVTKFVGDVGELKEFTAYLLI